MATITIRDLDAETKAKLRIRAAHNGRSMEAEVRALLQSALTDDSRGLGTRIHARSARGKGADLALPARADRPRVPTLPR